MKQINLKQMYGSTPASFQYRVAFALKETEEKPMKHTVRTILATAIILLLLTAVAYAAFSSQVLEIFGKFYGDNYKQWLEQGEVAAPGQSLVLDDVVFTVDEVIYRNNGLYGVGTIRPREGSDTVIIAEDHTPDEPYGYDIYGEGGRPEEAPAGTPTIADMAKKKGGRLLVVRALPDKIGVDGGTMLSPPCIGYTAVPQRDGSIRFSFEASDAVAIEKGDIYTIDMWSSVCEMTTDGERLQDTRHGENWTVEIAPEPISEQTVEPVAATAAPEQSIGNVRLIVPDEYTQTGTLPVYWATARDFGANLQPELFNTSGIAETKKSLIVFNDEARLDWSPETLFYNEYQGTYNGNYKNPDLEPDILPLKTLSHAASNLAGNVRSGWPGDGEYWEGIKLEKTALSGITLDEAKAQVEALLTTLNVEGYTCDFALDMDTERIQSMGTLMNREIQEHQYWNSPMIDYSQVAEKNEGFYLHYQNGVRTDGGRFDLHTYVTSEGIVNLMLRDMYIRGDVAFTPETLVSPETVMAALPAEMANSQFADMKLDSILSIELAYSPARAENKADGMVFTPAWYIVYRDTGGAQQDYDCYAIFNAINGELLYAMFQ